MANPFISICIPAFKRTDFLIRLLDSIADQSFKDFEVIVTDDSPDNSVQLICDLYRQKFELQYHKNEKALGTPANWNSAISKAKGEWIKLMHDDDWFSTPCALQRFADCSNSQSLFIFSAYTNHFEENSKPQQVYLSNYWQKGVSRNPWLLFSQNVIGPPSVILVHKSIKEAYDIHLKWRVDIEYYIRVLGNHKLYYISDTLINVGIHEHQVTQYTFRQPEVELPEGLYLLNKYGTSVLKHILVYDAWWRLMRNLSIRNEQQLNEFTTESWPNVIKELIKHLSMIPEFLLKNRFVSKVAMGISFLKNYRNI